MAWWPWDTSDIDRRLINIEQMVTIIWQRGTGEQDMSKLHDRLAELTNQLDKEATTTIANATESETEFQDIITKMEAVIDRLKKKNADDASQGSSTGGGSGAR